MVQQSLTAKDVMDPVRFINLCWPHVNLYDKQKEILYSVRDNDETVVPAGNALGKDFVSALCALWFFCSRRPARVVTTSVKHDQLNDVLWGEIRQFLDTTKYKLPIRYNHMKIRQIRNDGEPVPKCELVGQVVNQGEAMLGRHLPQDIPRTLVIFDEASGIDDAVYDSTDTWAHRKLVIGNCFPTTNFFYRGVKEGDLKAPDGDYFYRKVIQIKGADSPNVRLGLAQLRKKKKPTHEILVPGVLSFRDYQKRRMVYDDMLQSISLDAEFYEGDQVLMYPPAWLNKSGEAALKAPSYGTAQAIGVDSAQGNDSTVWTIIGYDGIIEQVSKKTQDTSKITGETKNYIQRFNVDPERVCFDAGGGGKEHADRLRSEGYNVRAIFFGEAATDPHLQRYMKSSEERLDEREVRNVFKNRRAEMYWLLRMILNIENDIQFMIHPKYKELRRQLSMIPLNYDPEGKLILPPKRKKDKDDKTITLTDILGCSPDEADSLVLAVFGMLNRATATTAGAVA